MRHQFARGEIHDAISTIQQQWVSIELSNMCWYVGLTLCQDNHGLKPVLRLRTPCPCKKLFLCFILGMLQFCEYLSRRVLRQTHDAVLFVRLPASTVP